MKRIIMTSLAALLLVSLHGHAQAENAVIIRSSPSSGSRIVTELDADVQLEVVRREDIAGEHWLYVIAKDGTVMGWVAESELPDATPDAVQMACTIGEVPLCQSPEGTVMLRLEAGTEVTVDEIMSSGWIRVRAVLYDGSMVVTGWVKASELKFPELTPVEMLQAEDDAAAPAEFEDFTLLTVQNTEIYSSPSTGSRIITQAAAGTEVSVIRIENIGDMQWIYGSIASENVMGWVMSSKLIPPEEGEPEASIAAAPIEVVDVTVLTVQDAEIYSSPSMNSRVLFQAAAGTEVSVLQIENIGDGQWIYGNIASENIMGWVKASELIFPEGESTEQMLLEALELHAAPSTDSVVLLQLEKGKCVDVFQKETVGGTVWAYVLAEPEHVMGWVETQVLVGAVTANLNVRIGPGELYVVAAVYDKGETVRILEEEEDWVRTADGWVYRKYLEEAQISTLVDVSDLHTGTVTKMALNIRSNPGSDFNFLGMYAKGDTITIFEIRDGWGRTELGWVNLDFVELDEK